MSFSTKDKNITSFPQHGSAEFKVLENNIILYEVTGPFNLELVATLATLEADAINNLKGCGKKWGEIVVFHHSCLAIEEAFKKLKDVINKLDSYQSLPYSSAYVIAKDIEGASIMKHKYQDCYADTKVKFCFFSDYQSALEWSEEVINS